MKNKGLTIPHDDLDDYIAIDNNLEVDEFDTDLQ